MSRGQSESERRIPNNQPFKYIAVRLLFEYMLDNGLPIDGFNLRMYGSGIVDSIIRNGVPSFADRAGINGPTAIVVLPEGETKNERFEIIKEHFARQYELKSILYIQESEQVEEQRKPWDPSDTSIRITEVFWDKQVLDQLYNSLSRSIRWIDWRIWLNDAVAELQQHVSHEDEALDDLKASWDLMHDIVTPYKKGELVLFLGTGINIDIGGLSWIRLLHRLRSFLLERDRKSRSIPSEKIQHLCNVFEFHQGSDPLIDAQILYQGMKKDYIKAVKNAIYNGTNDYEKSLDANTISSASNSLSAITRLCSKKKIHAIVTYNWDDLLERTLSKYGVDCDPISSDGYERTEEKMPIFHVHGYLPKQSRSWHYKEPPIVFREKEYHDLYNSPYAWANHLQIELLREKTCLFIGLSMKDPNLRRLLRISSGKHREPKHVVCLRRPLYQGIQVEVGEKMEELARIEELQCQEKSELIEAIQKVCERIVPDQLNDWASKALRVQIRNQMSDFQDLKVNVAWMDKYSRIIEYLNMVEQT